MNKDILLFSSISELYNEVGVAKPLTDYFDCHRFEDDEETLKASIPTYRNTLFQIALLTGGEYEAKVNDATHLLREGSLFLSGPGDIVSITVREPLKGFIAVFNDGFMSLELNRKEGYDAMALFDTGAGLGISLEPDKKSFFSFLFGQILEEQKTLNIRSFDIVRSFVTILLINARRIAEQQGVSLNVSEGGAALVMRFRRAISSHLAELGEGKSFRLKLVGEFAEELHVHANYLNEVVKKYTGLTASNLVQQQVAQEALALLRQTEFTINEVAIRLGFDTPAHFSSFFKRKTQLTPSDYRKLLKL